MLDRETGEFLHGLPYAKQTWAEGLDDNGRPINIPGMEPSYEGTLVWPSLQGATNWFSPSYSPLSKNFYVSVREMSAIYYKTDVEYEEGRPPQLQFNNIFIFPGIPEFLKIRFSGIKERFRTTPIVMKQIFLKADEGDIAASLDETQEAYPELQLGSYPKISGSDYNVKLTLECRDDQYLQKACDFLCERLRDENILRIK